jgi:hypothetical protein
MTHEEMEILISRWDDPDLAPSEREQLEQVLAEDSAGREVFQQYQRLDEQLGQMPDILESVDFDGFRQRVARAIATVERSGRGHRVFWRRWAPLAAAAAIMMVAIPWKMMSPEKIEPPTGIQEGAVVLVNPQAPKNYANHIHVVQLGQPRYIEVQPEDTAGEVICLAVVSSGPAKPAKTTRTIGILPILNGSS